MTVFTLYMKQNLSCYLLCDRVAQPHSVYWLSNDTDLVNSVTSQAASYIDLLKCYSIILEHPPNTTEAHSTIGNILDICRTYVVHLVECIYTQIILKFSHNSKMFATMVLICECHCPVLLKVTPRCL